jgi:hypothetical protein
MTSNINTKIIKIRYKNIFHMKNLIILFLVIGAVVSQTTLTTIGSAATADLPLWTLTYANATDTNYYSFTLTYYAGDTASTAVAASAPAIGSGGAPATLGNMGVACLFTESNFTLETGNVKRGVAFSIPSLSNGDATTSENTSWGTLAMTSYAEITYTVGSGSTMFKIGSTAGTDCPIVITNTGTPLPVVANFTVSWTFTVASLCGSLPAMGAGWYARCFHSADGSSLFVAASQNPQLVGGKSVTVYAAITTGASIFATGAIILAGIAYLQF